jgi:NAD(P)H-flavin reductase/ferredoxin
MMAKTCTVVVNGEAFSARCGDLLLDAALRNGIDIPSDCRSGYCGTCRVRVLDGWGYGGETNDSETVHACQCRVISDLKVAVEEVPEITNTTGRVVGVWRMASDVVEICIELPRPASYLPGQYYKVQFRGFPARCYSPTVPLDAPVHHRVIRLHVRQLSHGQVSSALGSKVREGHRVKLVGPFGSAFLRPHGSKRLILIASGTGFAPLWAIAHAALKENADREVVFVVWARELKSLYMIPALCRLAVCPNVTIIPVVSERQNISRAVRAGRPTDHLPGLSRIDVIYTAGAPAMVAAVTKIAKTVGAKCYADPFDSDSGEAINTSLISRALDWFSGDARSPRPLAAALDSGSRAARLPERVAVHEFG